MDLVFVHERTVNSLQQRGSRREEEHVAHPEQIVRTLLVQNRSRVDPTRHLEGHAGGEVRLDDTRQDVDTRPLGSKHEMDARGTRHLRQALKRLFDLLRRGHHEVGEFVDHDDDIRQHLPLDLFAFRLARLLLEAEGPFTLGELLAGLLIELIDVADARRGHHLIPLFHLTYDALQRSCSALRARHHVGDQMWNPVINRQLEHLRVN